MSKKELTIDYQLYEEEIYNSFYKGYNKGAEEFVKYLVESQGLREDAFKGALKEFKDYTDVGVI